MRIGHGFLVASKTFTTQETMTNAHTARAWFLEHAKEEKHIAKHFAALSTNEPAVTAFGIDKANMFGILGLGRRQVFTLSAIGLSIALTIGYNNFEQLLKGASVADEHFRKEKFDKNIPVLMALIGIWYTNFFGAQSEAILPYDQYMHRFAAYFQQGNMESNGKSVDRNGNPVNYATGPVIWGRAGHQWTARILSIDSSGNPDDPLRFYSAGHQPQPHRRPPRKTFVELLLHKQKF